ncbi:MAG TPA: hypothetical protein K8V51_00355 [Campylobacter avium]|uniref:hypothetical protein n=1 Tax=Campylobacter avium TaxID=522485 RepID=UPI001D578213|nr:hypothetical protein [Campylobacter avium]HJE65497.1 hypothetical protein [Campylobacter avium]
MKKALFVFAILSCFMYAETNTSVNFQKEIGLSLSTKDGTYINVSAGQGSGLSKEEATINALLEAITKMRGFSTANVRTALAKQKLHVFDVGYSSTLDTQIYSLTKGRIDTYEITSVEIDENGRYTVSVNAYKTLFKRDEKPTIAVFNDSYFKTLGDNILINLNNELIKSGKFTVLDRKSDKYYKTEKALMQSEDSSGEDLYKLGNVIGSDYMLVFNLRDIGASSSKSSNITVQNSSLKGDVVVDYRLLLFATKEIKAADSLILSISVKEDDVKSNEEASKRIANAISAELISKLYPLYVAMASDKEVVFEAELKKGDVYLCEGSTNSKVQILSSSKNTSSAKILEGQPRLADVCRLENDKGKEANYKLGEGGGVNLGF